MNLKSTKKINIILPLVISLFSLSSCQREADSNTIFVSSSPVYILVKEIVRDLKPITVITPPGVEAHDYEISARKVAGIYDGLGLFINGLGMESWSNKLPAKAKAKTFDLSDGVSTLCIEGKTDPHIWLNPKNAIKELETIKDAMITLDKDNSSSYLSNFNDAVARFETLDSECYQASESFQNKYLCVSHAAFAYLCDRYDLTQIYVNGLDPEQEPSTKTLEQIMKYVQENGITTIFAEEIGSKDIAKKISEETGCKLETLSTMESVDEAEDYCSLYRSNFKKIEEANK